jgi:ABC-type transport system involved in multi-copper enzyme maturation permease subunit
MLPIIRRELIGLLRTKRALASIVVVAVGFALLVLLRWPSEGVVDTKGARAMQVFNIFGYGLLAMVVLLTPVFPSTSIVRERAQGTLALLLNSPLQPWSIYFGKLAGVVGFGLILLSATLPAAAACYAMGGIDLARDLGQLYGLLAITALQYAAVGLAISSFAGAADSALRITYAVVLFLAAGVLVPHQFLQHSDDAAAQAARWLRQVSPVPAVMETLGHESATGQGLIAEPQGPGRYILLSTLITIGCSVAAIVRLRPNRYDRPRAAGVITQDRGLAMRAARRMFFVIDPQRRKSGIGWFTNPVLVKEFRSRRFGRAHWLLRLVGACAVGSLLLTFATTDSTRSWGTNTIGSLMVFLQMALIVLVTPALAAGLISTEREAGTWRLLQMTPLSAGRILRGKLLSVAWTLALVLCATIPGYLVMIWITPESRLQVTRVVAPRGRAARVWSAHAAAGGAVLDGRLGGGGIVL